MSSKKIYYIISFLLVVVASCVPPEKKEITEVRIDLQDSIYRRIVDFQDKRLTDSLLKYIDDEDPTYRYASVLAFASVQDTAAVDSIAGRLRDKISEVRTIAAYTLGQIGSSKAVDSLTAVFNKIDTLNPNTLFHANILEAIGKTGDLKHLEYIASVKSYRPTDTLLLLGQARALYRYIVRGMSVPQGTAKMVDFLKSSIYPKDLKYIASAYIMRANLDDLNKYKFTLSKAMLKEDDPFIKMNVAIAIGKTGDKDILVDLKKQLEDDDVDDKVKINILKAFGNFEYIDVVQDVLKFLEYPNPKVSLAAADYLFNYGQPNDVIIYRKYAKKELPWQVKARLYNALMKKVPVYFSKTKAATLWEIKKKINTSQNPYEKAEYIKALGYDVNSFKDIYELGFKAPEIIARVASMEAIATLVSLDKVTKIPKWKKERLKKDIANLLTEVFHSGEPDLIASSIDIFEKTKLDFLDQFENLDVIFSAKKKLRLPRDIEAYNLLLKLESKLKHTKYTPVKVKYNHPINWELFDRLPEEVFANIKTNKGDFKLKLFKEQAPGTVVNFVDLANKNFFDGKFFHRVVLNFVIQTGCPHGTGWGSLDYTIRSELGPAYYDDAGYVGMASAGKDTESSQWFVTLVPTPHLDGRYTLFGKVVDGMDVVNDIELSDIIKSVEITDR